MIFLSPAKINLGLRIVQKRQDGYHNIESIFVPIPLHDIIEIVPNQSGYEYVNTGILIDCPIEKNTCHKAYQLIRKHFPHIGECRIHHHKTIPTGMGLGAGSANAIAIMTGLKKLFQLQIDDALFFSMAEQIGSDCAFFLHQKTAFVSGKGDNIKPFEFTLEGYQLVLLLPKQIAVNTAWAYQQIVPQPTTQQLEDLLLQPIETWKTNIINDFEQPVFSAYPQLKKAKDDLYNSGAVFASLSGSGAALYGIFQDETKITTQQFEEEFVVKMMAF